MTLIDWFEEEDDKSLSAFLQIVEVSDLLPVQG